MIGCVGMVSMVWGLRQALTLGIPSLRGCYFVSDVLVFGSLSLASGLCKRVVSRVSFV